MFHNRDIEHYFILITLFTRYGETNSLVAKIRF